MKRFDFQAACTAMLKELGAVEVAQGYGLVLTTIAGPLQCKAYDTWLAAKFDDVPAAKAKVGFGTLNPFSGKWNWHFAKGTQEDVAYLRAQLQEVLP